MNQPKVSVIIPVYNVEPYLDQCMESLVGQTYPNLELIMVDDGATDNSGNMCDIWATRDNRIKVVHKANAGLGFARNTGMKHATGDFIGFIDSDDYVHPQLYEKMVECALADDADVVQCNYFKSFNDGSVKEAGDFNTRHSFSGDQCKSLAHALVATKNGFTQGLLHAAVWVCLFRRSAINTAYLSERMVGSEDIPFKAEIFLTCRKVSFIPDHLCFYRYNDNSLTRTYRFDLFDRYIELTRHMNHLFRKHTGLNNQADYLVLYMAVNSIRGMYLYNCPKNKRYDYFRQLIDHPIWETVELDQSKLSKGEKLIYRCIRHRRLRTLKFISDIYYAIRKLFPA
ncbi:MAG: glycosyltransferase [Muribaculaceae bacterium]|nr:glycosyltransferase [Muribaculaceae bacterium]